MCQPQRLHHRQAEAEELRFLSAEEVLPVWDESQRSQPFLVITKIDGKRRERERWRKGERRGFVGRQGESLRWREDMMCDRERETVGEKEGDCK